MLLRRLSYPNRLHDLEKIFGLSAPYISEICNTVMEIICVNKKQKLTNLNENGWLNRNKLEYYSQVKNPT